jgi:hypothetical protein
MANRWGADAQNLHQDENLEQEPWPEPDMLMLRLHRRSPPRLPLQVFGGWGDWIAETAEAAACPIDYVALPLLASASTLIGHARWAQAAPGWIEPPHLWLAGVGLSGNGKSPGSDCLMRDVLPEIERKMQGDFPDRLQDWRAAAEQQRAKEAIWKTEVLEAEKAKKAPPIPPASTLPPEPQPPRLQQYDVTIEKIEELLALAAPKGLLIIRDELSGWIDGMNAYNEGGRAFWVEAYGGRPYRVERKKFALPLIIPRLAVAVYGGTQPDKVAKLVSEADDGLLARLLWAWPDRIDFRLGQEAPRAQWAVDALDRLRMLELRIDQEQSRPIIIPLIAEARPLMAEFGREMQVKQDYAGGLLQSAYGKVRGQALRLSLNLEFLRWCAEPGFAPPPSYISRPAFAAATRMMEEYFVPMAERVYGDAGLAQEDRNAATLARWIVRDRPHEVYVRHVLRDVRLPGLTTAGLINKAAAVLVDAGWLREPAPMVGASRGRARNAYPVNPQLIKLPE